jgi:hypothetical protein
VNALAAQPVVPGPKVVGARQYVVYIPPHVLLADAFFRSAAECVPSAPQTATALSTVTDAHAISPFRQASATPRQSWYRRARLIRRATVLAFIGPSARPMQLAKFAQRRRSLFQCREPSG